MRATLVLDADIAQKIEQEARRRGRSLDEVVNDVLRIGLRSAPVAPASEPFKVHPHHFGFRQNLDLDKMNGLADELEAREASRKLGA